MSRYSDEWYAAKEIDNGIVPVLQLLHDHDIETVQSCQGGPGHSYPFPTIELTTTGRDANGFVAMAILEDHGYRVGNVSICWNVQRGLPVERFWRVELHAFNAAQEG